MKALNQLRPILGRGRRCLVFLAAAIVGVEVLSFVIVTAANMIFTGGHVRDMRQVVNYSPYSVFHHVKGPRPTTALPLASTKNAKIVWMFGGSTMRGSTTNDSLTIPSLVQREINTGNPSRPWSFRNYGENAYNSILESLYLFELLTTTRDRPSMVVFYDGANDTAMFSVYRRSDAHYGYQQCQAIVESYPRSTLGILKPLNAAWLASFTRELLMKIRYVGRTLKPDDPRVTEFASACETRYDGLHDLLSGLGIQFVVLWQPYCWAQNSCRSADSAARAYVTNPHAAHVRDSFRAVNEAVRSRLMQKSYFVNLQDALESGQGADAFYRADGVHLTDEGRLTVSRKIAQVLAAAPESDPARTTRRH